MLTRAGPAAVPKLIPASWARTWYWPRGHTGREFPGDAHYLDAGWHPAGAWWFRFAGDPKLRPVPGRPGELAITTEVSPC